MLRRLRRHTPSTRRSCFLSTTTWSTALQSLRLAVSLRAAARYLYRNNLSNHHLEAGVGPGFFIDRPTPHAFDHLTLLNINRHCLARSAQRLARYHPLLCETNLFAPIAIELEPVDSVGLTYVLH